MFQAKKYQKKDPKFILDFIHAHPLATFVLKGEELLATHIPILPQGDPKNFRLYGHIAQANEQFRYLKDDLEVLLIFHGPQGYVSSSWYHHPDISTWDYSAVHINARLKVQSQEELENSLRNLVNRFEKDQENPAYFEDIPKDMLQSHLPLITGFWCIPYKVQAIAKLHQGFEKKDVQSVIQHLEQKSDPYSTALSKHIKEEHDTQH